MNGRLNEQTVARAKAPKGGQLLIRDSEIRGFALRITANGCKAFVWDGRINGQMHRITLGRYPDMSAAEARTAALEIRHRIALGMDPAHERAERQQELTVGELAGMYLERHAKAHKLSWREDERKVRLYFGTFDGCKLSALATEGVIRWHQRIGSERGRYMANRCLTLLATMFNLAERWGCFRGRNPAVGVQHFREEKRDRFLNAEELKRLGDALASEPSPYWRAYFQLALLLGTRKNELLHARWSEMDFNERTWRIPITKARRPHLLPLPLAAIQILESLPSRRRNENLALQGIEMPVERFSGANPSAVSSHSLDWVFPSAKRPREHLSRADDAWQRIQRRAGLPDVRIHDLRRTLGSWLAAQGYSLPLIGRALNHSSISTTQIYARLDLGPVREALERNAKLMIGSSGNTGCS